MKHFFWCVATAFVMGLAVPAAADEDVVLNVRIGETEQSYSVEALKALGDVEVETTTIWTEGMQHFAGVPLKTVLDALGAQEGVVVASAVNDYAVKIPLSEVSPEAPIIAFERNGLTMSRRNKGPLWVIYPYDSDPSYRTEEVYSRSIWQLNRLAVE